MLKVKSGYVLREIAGNWLIIPVGQRVVECNSIMSVNNSGAILWKSLEKGNDLDGLVQILLTEFDTDENTARTDVNEFIEAVSMKGLLEQC